MIFSNPKEEACFWYSVDMFPITTADKDGVWIFEVNPIN
jgi:hypothetical protein